jgi:alpha/beta superfamily hydrolase
MLLSNQQSEKLDVLIEDVQNPQATVVMAHGVGTDKHETDGQFDDIAKALLENNFRVVRFDFAGFGQSEGKSEDFDLKKGGTDLQAVIDWVRNNFAGDIYLVAQSMATAITCFHQPKHIIKTVFTAHVNPYDLVSGIKHRIKSRPGGLVDEAGISIYPRSSGQVQKFGPTFWLTLRSLDFMTNLKQFAATTDLLIIRPKQDEIVLLNDQQLNLFRNQTAFKYVEIDGDHSFRGKAVRETLIDHILQHFQSN